MRRPGDGEKMRRRRNEISYSVAADPVSMPRDYSTHLNVQTTNSEFGFCVKVFLTIC